MPVSTVIPTRLPSIQLSMVWYSRVLSHFSLYSPESTFKCYPRHARYRKKPKNIYLIILSVPGIVILLVQYMKGLDGFSCCCYGGYAVLVHMHYLACLFQIIKHTLNIWKRIYHRSITGISIPTQILACLASVFGLLGIRFTRDFFRNVKVHANFLRAIHSSLCLWIYWTR